MTCHHTRSESKPYCVTCDPLEQWLPLHDRFVTSRELERILDIINKETGHYGATHYEGMNCKMCRVFRIARGEEK